METYRPPEQINLSDEEKLKLAFARRVRMATTIEDQQRLVQEFSIRSVQMGIFIDWFQQLPFQVIDDNDQYYGR